ncbi:hypothetical protein [Shewanella aestuarii]|uniref:Uncharacterized protein n=1 Tax=Shewanella aestuarii TaxID=1028752 RepID=A0A6G9QIN6_9GAMM|nr:hypothetical protein [Shewanella aestuarii]QIR13925.1 hypothetical protein HBH39_04950 [Shewanella aestuarii]
MKSSLVKRLENLKSDKKLVYPQWHQFKNESEYVEFMNAHNPGVDWREKYRPLEDFY